MMDLLNAYIEMNNTLATVTHLPSKNDSDSTNHDYEITDRANLILSQPQNVVIMVLAIVGITINIISILAISQLRHRPLTSHFRLILNLAVSDVLIGFSLLFFLLINAFVPLYPVGAGPADARRVSRCLFCFSKALNSTGLAITLLNLFGMAVDHYIAIKRPLHYSVLLSRERCICMIAGQWLISIVVGFSNFLSGYPMYRLKRIQNNFNYCEFIHITKYQEEYTVFVLSVVCLISMLFIYIRIYIEVKKNQGRAQKMFHAVIKNKRAIFTTLLILGAFILCWIPMGIFTIVLVIMVNMNPELVARNMEVLYKVDSSLFILLLLNIIADPIIYASRVKDIQLGYKRLFCRHYLARRRSNASYDTSQYTAFMDFYRKSSRGSSTMVFVKHKADSIPMIKGAHALGRPEISIVTS